MLQSLLGAGQSDDYWSDEHIVYAQQRLLCLSTDEWRTLSNGWASLDLELQDRLAGLLGYGGTTQEVEVLLQICWRADRDIELTARESLRGMSVDVVKAAIEVAVRKGELPAEASKHVSTINRLLDFLRAERVVRDAS